MTFFERKGIWKSLLEFDDEESNQKQQHQSYPTLDDAAAVSRFLTAEETVRPALVIRNKRHPHNLFKIELITFDASQNHGREIGSVSFHLHDVIKATPIAGTYDLWNDNIQVGDIDLELTFSYGSFGYGYSYQLKEEDITNVEQVQYSLLPRVTPRRDQREPNEVVMVVCATPHPNYIPFKEPMYLSYGKEIQEVLEEARDQTYTPVAFKREMSKFQNVRDEYFSTPDRVARLMFLRNYLKSSTNQHENIIGQPDKVSDEGLPAKSYMHFAVPVGASKLDNSSTVVRRIRTMSNADQAIDRSDSVVSGLPRGGDGAGSGVGSGRMPGGWPGI
ncbi:hypothetical protein HDU76_002828 [Blyttiomyces sp. JEL0837]|nr:hypothetical protein HDU76_002828 [Blyttiomyces sp. JEL0837]